MLETVTETTTKSHTLQSYFYDGDGLRVSRKDNMPGGITTYYIWDSENPTGYPQVVEEIEGGQVVRRYGYGHFLENVDIWNGSAFDRFYVVRDGTNSVRMLLDSTGNISATYDYDAFGNILSASNANPLTVGNHYQFHSEYKDTATNLVYLRARWYDVEKGRFVGMDSYEGSQGSPSTLNKYVSFNNNPTNMTDPSGFVGIVEMAGTNSYMSQLSYLSKIFFATYSKNTIAWMVYTGTEVQWYTKRKGEEKKLENIFRGASGFKGNYKGHYADFRDTQFQSFTDPELEGGGPIPAGNYYINLSKSLNPFADAQDTQVGATVDDRRLSPRPGGGIERIPTTPYDYTGSWGNVRAYLQPFQGTNTFGRGNTYLHDSIKNFTHGCVETDSGAFDMILMYRINHPSIGFYVSYSGSKTFDPQYDPN